jgi:cytochrome b pre-mRNA-processing protein 3
MVGVLFHNKRNPHLHNKLTRRLVSVFLYLYSFFTPRRWFGPGRIGRDFRSYQALLTMHIWFLHKRLINETSDPHQAALIQEELFDIFWADSSNRMRAHGVNEWLIQKNLKTVQQYTLMHLFHYDHCYTGELLEDPSYRLEELKNLVKTHVLLLSPGDEVTLAQHDDQAERIAWYVEAQYQNIVHDLPDDFHRKARIAWVDLPSFDGMIDGNTGKELPQQPIHPEDVLPDGWKRNIANDGTYYYWNVHTREAQWEHPKNVDVP